MSLGIVMLVHTALNRATEVARFWASAGCPVVIHVDKSVPRHTHDAFVESLADQPQIRFSKRFHCEWGTWGIVAAAQAASEMMLANHPEVQHVYLCSGACLPLRPVQELQDHLDAHRDVDFIESVSFSDTPWTMGGLDRERFSLYFLFAWRKRRKLFDRSVEWQRKLKIDRKMPYDLVPHLGSQWWCLSRKTLSAILTDKRRPVFERYFKRVWIPDESYFQSLVRLHSKKIESRSLTLSKFDFQGKPHVFYDDHLQLLRSADAFVARKIWPFADRLYQTFLNNAAGVMQRAAPEPVKVDQIFSKALERRTKGRPGLYMQSRFPRSNWENGITAAPYSVFHGFSELFEDFESWLHQATNARVHGHLFARQSIEYADGNSGITGALSDSVPLRNYDPKAFLTNLIWNTKGEYQCFQFGPADQQRVRATIVKDPNAHVSVITGAWAIPLFRSEVEVAKLRNKAADLQRIESAYLKMLQSSKTKARVHIWSLAEFVVAPTVPLEGILNEIAPGLSGHFSEPPKMVDLSEFGQFLQDLRNAGLGTYLMGDFPLESDLAETPPKPVRPYLVK